MKPTRRAIHTWTLRALAVATSSVWMQHVLAAGNQPLPPGIRSIKGQVAINGVAAREGQAVLPGDTVSTAAGSEAVYVMGRNAFLMRERSEVSFSAGAVAVMRVVTGRVLSVFGPGQQTIETATATIGIRGTGCYIESDPKQVYFCLCYGRADIQPLADPQQARTVVTRYHDTPFTIGSAGASLINSAPVINHTDAELTLLEAAVGRRPPFQGPGRY